jgi:hypothetical protein
MIHGSKWPVSEVNSVSLLCDTELQYFVCLYYSDLLSAIHSDRPNRMIGFCFMDRAHEDRVNPALAKSDSCSTSVFSAIRLRFLLSTSLLFSVSLACSPFPRAHVKRFPRRHMTI